MTSDEGLVLSGLDGSNPLGFLAAVGVLRTIGLTDTCDRWRMKWVCPDGRWLPLLTGRKHLAEKELVGLLDGALKRDSTPEFDFAPNLGISTTEFRTVAEEAQSSASHRDRRYADFVASFGCEVFESKDRKTVQNTGLRTLSGAGHQDFLGTMKKLVCRTKASHLRRSLFEVWDYTDERLGLRWDPEEDRRYALRWDNPSPKSKHAPPPKTMHGANRLAIEALPLLPTIPTNRRLETTGFWGRANDVFTWPIWVRHATLDVVRSLLAAVEVQESRVSRDTLSAMGVTDVFQSRRITIGKFRNFTHAQPA